MRSHHFTSLIAIFILCSNTVFAATIYVPEDLPTIQEGIDAAEDGDIVLVAPGTYLERIDFLDKAITLLSEAGPAATVIDGSLQAGAVVTFADEENEDAIMDGFYIKNGSGTSGPSPEDSYGGGILCYSSSPTIANCIIAQNTASAHGGGVYLSNSSPIITDCMISGNSAAYYGGGIYCSAGSPEITNCTISGNSAGYYGGGIYCCCDSSPTVTNCILLSDSASAGREIWLGTAEDPSAITISESNVQDEEASVYVSASCILDWPERHIGEDQFSGDDYHLSGESPLVDVRTDSRVNKGMDGRSEPAGLNKPGSRHSIQAEGGGEVGSYIHAGSVPYTLKNPLACQDSDWTISGNDIYSAVPGNVGIGVTAPVEKLDVNGAIRLGTNAGQNAGTLRWSGSDFEGYNGMVWQSLTGGGAGGGDSDWSIAGQDMYSAVPGMVGIGTLTPAEKLDVAGNLLLENYQACILFKDDPELPDEARIRWEGPGYPDKYLHLQSWDQNSLETVGLVVKSPHQNVGVGTTNPLYPLHVAGSAGFSRYLYHAGDDDTYISFETDKVDLQAGGAPMITASGYEVLVGPEEGARAQDPEYETVWDLVVNEDGGEVDFRVESVEDEAAFFVRGSDGMVGMGTEDPAVSLDLRGTTVDDTVALQIGNSDLSHRLLLAGGGQDDPSPHILWEDGDTLHFATSADGFSEQMRIQSDGSVGIGVEAPLAKAHIVQTDEEEPAFRVDNVESLDREDLTPFIIDRYGNVGVGRAAPSARTHIIPNSLFEGEPVDLFRVDDVFDEHDDDATPFLIDEDGNVGIGTDDPDEKLTVVGDMNLDGDITLTTHSEITSPGAIAIKSDQEVVIEVGGSRIRVRHDGIDITTDGTLNLNGNIVNITGALITLNGSARPVSGVGHGVTCLPGGPGTIAQGNPTVLMGP